MTTETIEAPVFDIPKARNELAGMQVQLDEARNGIIAAAAIADMVKITELSALVAELPKKIDRLERKIRRESGEDVLTKKAEVSAALKVLVAEFMRSDAFVSAVNEVKIANPKLKAINITLDGSDAIQPESINLVGGYRTVSAETKAKGIKRPRAQWYKDDFGFRQNENGETEPAFMGSQQVYNTYAPKYGYTENWAQIPGNERQLRVLKIVEGEGLKNLQKKD